MNEDLKHRILKINVDKYFEHLERFSEANDRLIEIRSALNEHYKLPDGESYLSDNYQEYIQSNPDILTLEQEEKQFSEMVTACNFFKERGFTVINFINFCTLKHLCENGFAKDKQRLDEKLSRGIDPKETVINQELQRAFSVVNESEERWLMDLETPFMQPTKNTEEYKSCIFKAGTFWGRVKFIQYLEAELKELIPTTAVTQTLNRRKLSLPEKIMLLNELDFFVSGKCSKPNELDTFGTIGVRDKILGLLLGGEDESNIAKNISALVSPNNKFDPHKHKGILERLKKELS